MFKNYYAVLNIAERATPDEIKKAFREQAIKWHPDRNKGVDTTYRMQEINEAYLILKDTEARARYDKEYQRFKAFKQQESNETASQRQEQKNEESRKSTFDEHSDFRVEDDVLNKWMQTAKKQAVNLAQQTIEDFKGVSVAASQGFLAGVKQIVVWVIVINLIFFCLKSCGNL